METVALLAGRRQAGQAGSQEAARILAEQGVRPAIDSLYPLDEANPALVKLEKGGVCGKNVLSMEGK